MKKLNLTLLLAVFFTAFSFAQVPNYVPTNGLVGWWPFNGNANDESGNGNNGTVNGATLTTDRNGVANSAYGFYGIADTIIINILNNNGDWTLNFWVYTPSSNNFGFQFPMGFGSQAPSSWGLPGFGISGNNQQVPCTNLLNNKALISDAVTECNSNRWLNMVTTNTWYNYSITKSGTNYTVYNQGIQIFSGVMSNIILNKLKLGARLNTSYLEFNGKLDDIGIWNRALTQQEITALYQSCNLNLTTSPTQANPTVGTNVAFNTSGATTYQWQTNPANYGWTNINNNSTYGGATTASLNVNNVQLYNHQQQFRVIGIDGSCTDTAYASIVLADTCVNSVYDTTNVTIYDTTNITIYDTLTVYDTITTSITVTDTLLINAVISGVNPPNNVNTLQVYPNPANTHITIDNGNFALMAGFSVRINNALGQVVFNQNITQQQFFIDLSTWTGPGLYYVNILDQNGTPIEVKVIVIQ